MADNPAQHADAVRRAVERINATQARCGTKLVQVPAYWVWDGPKFEAGDVDVEFLVKDILDAALIDGRDDHGCRHEPGSKDGAL